MSASTASAARPAAMVDFPFTFRWGRTTTHGLRSMGTSSRLIAHVQHALSGWRYRVSVAADTRLLGSR